MIIVDEKNLIIIIIGYKKDDILGFIKSKSISFNQL